MNRTILVIAGVFGASSLLLVDSAVKGTALLILAAIAALVLRRDSAATRHLVWLLAIAALLAVPVLSGLLPQWRVLPKWASTPPAAAVAAASPPSIAGPAVGAIELARNAGPDEVGSPSAAAHSPAAALPDSPPALAMPQAVAAPIARTWHWLNALPLLWAIGFCVLVLRLMAARWMLWNTERQGTAVWPSRQPTKSTDEAMVTALEAARLQLGICRPVTLLIHPEKTIPVVWGILRCRLLLPIAARQWSGEQLRSVLLHELAHIKRRDTIAQLLTQIACTLHWFNPLVWYAAWRLGVERERACDDLVLASGVRPSAYAGHLLEVVTELSPARWAQSCGLTMARKSSLNGRLAAVLSQKLNRRGVTTALAVAALLLGIGIAVPIAMLRAAEPDKPKPDAPAVNPEPKDAESKPLFENWKTTARVGGKIPGGRIGELAASLKTFMGLNPGNEQTVKLGPVVKKCDASRDWAPGEAAALLDEIAAISPQAQWTMRAITERQIHSGKPLPDELANAPWGKPAPNGLRTAWLLEPLARAHALDTVMKSRVLFHNTGKATVCFATEDWIQSGRHKATDANGKDISVWAVERENIPLRMNFRLAPGEYAEVEGHGIGVGPHETSTEKSIYRVGCWIEAKEGDEVTFTPGSLLVSFQTWQNNEGRKDSVTVWREMIAARVMREGPMPAAAADREQLLRRVTMDLLGTAPTAGEVAAFVADDAPDALAKLTARLQAAAGPEHFAGELSGAATKFLVTAAVVKKDEPKAGAQLKPATEQKLKWGDPAKGLRMALAWPPSLGEPGMGDAPVFYLVVQNVSQAKVRLTASDDAAANPRTLTMRNNGSPLDAISYASPTPGDWLLQPGEVAFLRLFPPAEKLNDGRTFSAVEEEAVRVYPQYSLTAEMTIEKAPAGAWRGKLATGESRGSLDVIPPTNKDAQALYKSWTSAARVDGKIPGGVIAKLAQIVKTFIKNNPAWATTPQLEKMLPRFDGSRDWNAQEAVALLDELAAVQDTPITMALDDETEGIIREGTPLPPGLAKAPWGEALPNGLRTAWLLEPRAAEYRLGTPLKARILIHNAGKEPVVFRTRSWHQLGVKASDAKGAEIKVDSTEWLTIGLLTLFRLQPGEFIEVNAPGIGVGANKNDEDWQNAGVGAWIEAKAGDDVTVTAEPVPLSDWNETPQLLDGEPRWWLDHIKARLARHLPFPADAGARQRLLYRIAMELFGTPVSQGINDAFVADKTPAALDALAQGLFHRPGQSVWSGPLQSAPTKFHVLPPDPDAAKKPRVASNPGRYTLSGNAVLVVTRRPVRERIVNEASIQFASPDPAKAAPGEPHQIELPAGYGTWAAAWVRDSSVLWVLQKGKLRGINFTNPANVKETDFEESAGVDKVPKPVLDALHAELDVPAAPPPAKETPPPAAAGPPGPVGETPK